jgi:hypothetical protein
MPREVGQRTPTAGRVTAHLIFRNPENADEQQLTVNFGTWLGEYTHYRSFGPGQAHRLLILMRVMHQLLVLDNPISENPLVDRRYRTGMVLRSPTQIPLKWRSGEVDLTLVNNGVTVFQGVFEYREMALRPI